MKIKIESWKTGKFKNVTRKGIVKTVPVTKKFIVFRERGIIHREKYSTNQQKFNGSLRRGWTKSFRLNQTGKLKTFNKKYGKYNFITAGSNTGFVRYNTKKVKALSSYSFQLHAYIIAYSEDGKIIAKGWGHSSLFYVSNPKKFKPSLEKAKLSAWRQFAEDRSLPTDIIFKIRKMYMTNFI